MGGGFGVCERGHWGVKGRRCWAMSDVGEGIDGGDESVSINLYKLYGCTVRWKILWSCEYSVTVSVNAPCCRSGNRTHHVYGHVYGHVIPNSPWPKPHTALPTRSTSEMSMMSVTLNSKSAPIPSLMGMTPRKSQITCGYIVEGSRESGR